MMLYKNDIFQLADPDGDRDTRLILGFYIGLENPCWIAAMQAILSITTDKAALCKRYGVKYDPEHWPADGILPEEFFADRGEMVSRPSDYVCEDLHKTVTNMSAMRPDLKPIVEGTFHVMHVSIADTAPAYDPPRNAKKRRGKNYSKDACLTLDAFITLMLEFIIKHNTSPRLNANLPLDELIDGFEPSPINLWNRRIVTRSGLLSRYSEDQVRYALLPRDMANVSKDGIEFKGCLYTSPEAAKNGWFVQARRKNFKIEVSYDLRLVDAIYVRDPVKKTKYSVATLLSDSFKYRGLSFSEVNYYERLSAANKPRYLEAREQKTLEFHEATAPLITSAKKTLKQAGTISRSARRTDTKPARTAELKRERRETVPTLPRQETATEAVPLGSGSKVVSINTARTSPDPAINKLPGYLQDMLPTEGQSPEPEATPSARPGILTQEQRNELNDLKRQMTNG
jgi:hypothetical protein